MTVMCFNCGLVAQETRDRRAYSANGNWYCPSCDRGFQNQNNINMHNNSRTHRGQEVTCEYCGSRFVGGSGLAHHLEFGNCPGAPGLNRDSVFSRARSNDPYGVITNEVRNPTGSAQREASASSWNGNKYECDVCHQEFSQLRSLEQHMNSSIHEPPRYHCPNRRCGMEFQSYGALSNHLESESCGHMRFEDVQRRAGDFDLGNGRRVY